MVEYLEGAWLSPPCDSEYKNREKDECVEEVGDSTESIEKVRDITNQDQDTSSQYLHRA